MTQLLLSVVLLTCGLASGVLLGSVMGPVPLLRSLPPSRYVEVHTLLARRPEPFQPICFGTAMVCDVLLTAVVPTGPTRFLYGLAAILEAGVILVSKCRSNPIKRFATSLDPDNIPTDWARIDPRRRMARWNLTRTALAVAALMANVGAAVASA